MYSEIWQRMQEKKKSSVHTLALRTPIAREAKVTSDSQCCLMLRFLVETLSSFLEHGSKKRKHFENARINVNQGEKEEHRIVYILSSYTALSMRKM